MIFRKSNQCTIFSVFHLKARHTVVKGTMLVSVHSLIQSDLLSVNPIAFIFNFPVHFSSYDNDKEFNK